MSETIINVKDFGAKGDGTDDDSDSKAVQQAILHASTLPQPTDGSPALGYALYFPRGSYKLHGTIELAGSVRVYGDEIGMSRLCWTRPATKRLDGDPSNPNSFIARAASFIWLV